MGNNLHLVLKLVNFSRLALGPSTERVEITLFTLFWWVSGPKTTVSKQRGQRSNW